MNKKTRSDSYTKEHINYLKEIADGTGRTNKEITQMFNEKFNENRTEVAIIGLKYKLGIKSYLRVYTDEQLDYLREITPGRFNKEITDLFNDKFKDNRTEGSIKSIRYENDMFIGSTGRFEKGHSPPNKLPVGAEIERSDGYVYIKIEEPNVWKSKSRLIYEEVNGEIPEDHIILFGDNNPKNFNIDNLICISRCQLLGLNRDDLIYEDIELTKTGINIVNLKQKISEVMNNGNKD